MDTGSHLKQADRSARDRQTCRNAACSRATRETRLAVTGATEVHRALCAPGWQRVGVYEIASRVVPARHVGGDFVCSFEHGDKTYVVLGDLMGKGLSAAMWISHTIDLVHRAAEGVGNVSDILSRLNLEVLHSRVRAPLTSAIAFVIDPATDVISCASAGNPPAVVLRDGTDTLVTTAGGPLLGAFPDAHYSREDIHLGPGESLIAFSDGLVEAAGEDHEEFTIDRVMAVASEERTSSAQKKISQLLAASASFAGETPLDDVSILVVQRN